MRDPPVLRLPAGMRDFAPRAAAARRRLAETLLGAFERWGFARVITPAFEYEDVLALGLGPAGRAAAIRFVEPTSGQVVALRPDITPQIARLVATRFRDETGPLRLCYEGTVVRLERGARAQRELIQAGVELFGVAGSRGDAEVIALGASALSAAGLADPTIELGHLGLARQILGSAGLTEQAVGLARERIAKRDRAGLDEVLRSARGPRRVVSFLRLLPELAGAPSVLAAALRRAPTPRATRALEELVAIVREVETYEVPAKLRVDLAEVRGFDYYTGVIFQGFVPGAADAVLRGGRYDDLLTRYGRPCPAVGFAVDVESAAGALESREEPPRGRGDLAASEDGVLIAGPARAAAKLAQAMRREGRRVALDLDGMRWPALRAYAERWGFSEVLKLTGNGTIQKKLERSPGRTGKRTG